VAYSIHPKVYCHTVPSTVSSIDRCFVFDRAVDISTPPEEVCHRRSLQRPAALEEAAVARADKPDFGGDK
jgi:hypothetical protein